MRRQIGSLLPYQAGRNANGARTAALRYASWGWPVTPSPDRSPTTDLEQVYASWTRLPGAPVFAACAAAFDVVLTSGPAGRPALARLERLGVNLGPVAVDHDSDGSRRGGEQLGFLVRAGSAQALGPLWDRDADSRLLERGDLFQLPAQTDGRRWADYAADGRVWLREPSTPPMLPAAHVVIGALALAPYRTLATR
jgi:Bifunctional DNA primase/polymerase, N-terminal